MQEAAVKTDDGIAEKTQGQQWMTYAEAGRVFEVSPLLDIEPIISISRTMIDFDSIHDAYGKTADYEPMALTELEFGIKFSQQRCRKNGKHEVYVKPAVVQAWSSGDKVRITGMDKERAYEDNTLGRIEVGTNVEFDNGFSTYGFANYSTGSHYESLGAGLGLRYSW